MLSRVVRPDGKEVSFAYDALGRRTEKTYEGITTHFVWDGNVPLHEWQEVSSDAGRADVTTWLFEQDTFIPAAKLAANGESFSIVSASSVSDETSCHSCKGTLPSHTKWVATSS